MIRTRPIWVGGPKPGVIHVELTPNMLDIDEVDIDLSDLVPCAADEALLHELDPKTRTTPIPGAPVKSA